MRDQRPPRLQHDKPVPRYRLALNHLQAVANKRRPIRPLRYPLRLAATTLASAKDLAVVGWISVPDGDVELVVACVGQECAGDARGVAQVGGREAWGAGGVSCALLILGLLTYQLAEAKREARETAVLVVLVNFMMAVFELELQ